MRGTDITLSRRPSICKFTSNPIHTSLNNTQYSSYKFNTTLTISRITQDDFNKEIRCVSKNKLGIAKISFFLVTQAQFKNYKDGDSPLESGEIPPPKESYESLCPEQRPCDECPTLK